MFGLHTVQIQEFAGSKDAQSHGHIVYGALLSTKLKNLLKNALLFIFWHCSHAKSAYTSFLFTYLMCLEVIFYIC